MTGDYMTMVLVCNTDMLKEAGVDPARFPATWDGFLDVAKRVAKPGQQWGLGMVGAKDPGFSLGLREPWRLNHRSRDAKGLGSRGP